jgi:hypothetical protein
LDYSGSLHLFFPVSLLEAASDRSAMTPPTTRGWCSGAGKSSVVLGRRCFAASARCWPRFLQFLLHSGRRFVWPGPWISQFFNEIFHSSSFSFVVAVYAVWGPTIWVGGWVLWCCFGGPVGGCYPSTAAGGSRGLGLRCFAASARCCPRFTQFLFNSGWWFVWAGPLISHILTQICG